MAVLKIRSGGAWIEVPVGIDDHGALGGLSDDDHPQYGVLADAESLTGLWNFIASGAGGLTDYDLTVGDVATPDYGLIRIGNSVLGRTSYNAASLDLDGAVIFRNVGGPVTGQIEFVFTESGASAIRFALAKAGVGNATYNPRSMFIAGPAVNDDDIVTVAYWQAQGIFHNLVCDTAGDGADLGVQNDLEVEGDIFNDSIKESTPDAGVTVETILLKDGEIDGVTPAALAKGAIEFIIDGGGSVITTGIKGDFRIPFACTIVSVTLLADQSGSIVVDIWKQAYADYPPEDANSITASAVPTISGAVKSEDTSLTGWTTGITAGDTLRFNVDSVATIERMTVVLEVNKT